MEQFPITVLIVLLTIIIVIVLLQIIKIINSNKGVGYYSFKECFDSENTKNGIENGIIKTSFFYFDKIEKDIKKKILKIDDENKYTFYCYFDCTPFLFTTGYFIILLNYFNFQKKECYL